ncbi:VOC family protein [Aquibium carbonis]|uniref:VOC family protein n=1 Tax=Aquibium carbonis TaxID=2495581 RepID=A0A3S0A9L8_9HYPH|nr:VOC family protein [Aquibium carbonis]RST87833.1 VOC family protein [Aquibium carbonis]
MSTSAPTAAIDHLVLPTASLDDARARLGALGFTVAPTGVHPFGTANCCVYLAYGTFLEPLAVADASACAVAAADGNVFVARDQAFRAAGREDGFSAIVLATRDAEADHATFRAAGLSAGDMLSFSRPFQDATGKTDTASFRLAFATMPETVPYVFSCQRVNAPAVDRSALERHANGVARVVSATVVAVDPPAVSSFFAAVTGVPAQTTKDGLRLILSNGELVLRAAAAADGTALQGAFGFSAVTFEVPELAAVHAQLEKNGVVFAAIGNAIVAPPAPGQGATFIFEERA